jgi:serine/threonine-protein kinase
MRICQRCGQTYDDDAARCAADGAALREAVDNRVGTRVGRYVIVDRIGRGARGYVYQGIHPVIGSRVAIKILHAPAREESEAYLRFSREAQAVNRIQHQHIVRILDMAVLADDRPYILMEYLEGTTLGARMTQGPPLRLDEARDVVEQALAGLQAAHDARIIHRDLKPANIYVTRDNLVKLLDFGIAKLMDDAQQPPITRAGAVLGTPLYLAPELALGKNDSVGPATDLYAMGVILYELYAGRSPFAATSTLEVLQAHVEQVPPPPSRFNPRLPPELEAPILACLEKDPEARPPSAAALRERLTAAHAAYTERAAATGEEALPPFEPVASQPASWQGAQSGPHPMPDESGAGAAGRRVSSELDLDQIMRGSGRSARARRRLWLRRATLATGSALAAVLATLAVLYGSGWGRPDPDRAAGPDDAPRPPPPPRSGPRAGAGAELTVLLSQRPTQLDPGRSLTTPSSQILMQTHEPLVRYDLLTGRATPVLATRWRWRGRALELQLRPGVRFHDGTLLTAEHAAASLERARRAPAGRSVLWDVRRVRAVGPRRLRVEVSNTSHSLLMRLGLVGAFLHRVGPTLPPGTGPFRVERFEPATGQVRLVPHEAYWGEAPRLRSVRFAVSSRPARRRRRLRAGRAHILATLDPAATLALKGDPRVDVLRSTSATTTYLVFNTRRAFLARTPIRRALAQAVPRAAYVRAQFAEQCAVASSSLPPGLVGGRHPRYKLPDHDPAAARRALRGVARPASPLLLYLTNEPTAALPRPKRAARLLIAAFEAIGVSVNAVFVSLGDLVSVLRRGRHDLALVSWQPDYPDPENVLMLLSRHGQRAGLNFAGYTHPRLEGLLEQIRYAERGGDRIRYVNRANRLVSRDLPWLPLAYVPSYLAKHRSVRGLRYGVTANRGFHLHHTELDPSPAPASPRGKSRPPASRR